MVKTKSVTVILLFVLTLVWTAALSRPDGKTHLWTSVHKDRIGLIIRSSNGSFALINPDSEMLQDLGRRLPFYERHISLIVVTQPKSSSFLDQLLARFKVDEIWENGTDQNISESNKTFHLSGQQVFNWGGLQFSLWSIPDQNSLVTISYMSTSLALAGNTRAEFWNSVPDLRPVNILIGPSVGKSSWLTDQLYHQLQPQLVLADGASSLSARYASPQHQEIVWDQDSWYIKSSL